MSIFSGTRVRTILAGAGFALAGTLAVAPAASAVSQASAESQFRAAGVGWTSSGGCTTRSNPTCTSFEGIRQATISGGITLKRASGCALTITGGTEVGHASGTYSHYNGYKVDIARSTCNDNYITGHYAYIGLRGDGYPQYQAASGNVYVNEGSHWDITYYTCGC